MCPETVKVGSHAQAEGHGDAGHDYLTDGVADQQLYGGGGRDILIASAGADRLYGGYDADALQGGAGDDYHTALAPVFTASWR